MSKRTPLYDIHVKYNGTIVDFAGYELPIQYPTGIIAEHTAVREKAGLFDVSHMGELFISGKDAETALNYLLTNDIRGMYDGQVRYSLLPNEKGGAVDDVLIYRFNSEKFLVVVNAANADKDANWISTRLKGDVKFENASDGIAQIALQGPASDDIISKLCKSGLPTKYYSFKDGVDVDGITCLVSKTGYTGENGYELYCNNEFAIELYEKLMVAGEEFGLIPTGLGARDTLRLEAAMPLYGHELGENIPVDEVGLNFAIKMNKEDFICKNALAAHVPQYTRIGFEMADRGIAREHTPLFADGKEVGYVTSGTFAPSLKKGIGMARVLITAADADLKADVRGKMLAVKRVALPFNYKNK